MEANAISVPIGSGPGYMITHCTTTFFSINVATWYNIIIWRTLFLLWCYRSELDNIHRGPNIMKTLFYAFVTLQLVEGVLPDLQLIAASCFPFFSLLPPTINLSSAIVFKVNHLRPPTWLNPKPRGSGPKHFSSCKKFFGSLLGVWEYENFKN